jgi:hypothetical protein
MGVAGRNARILIIMAVLVWPLLEVGAAAGGEVAGRVVHQKYEAARAHLGGMMGAAGAMQAMGNAPEPLGPVLVYVGQADGEMPHRTTASVRLRMTSGGMTPVLQAVSVGSTVEFENADRSAHRLQGTSKHGSFDLGWQAGGTQRAVRLDNPGLVTLRCAIQGRKLGELVVLPHSCFALVDAGGAFRLIDVPPGPATVVAYSPRLGEVSRQVVVAEDGSLPLDLTF